MRLFKLIILNALCFLGGLTTMLPAANKLKIPPKNDVEKIMRKVADWQIDNFDYAKEGSGGLLHDRGIDAWTNGTLYIGMGDWAKIAQKNKDNKYYDWLYDIGDANNWKIPANFTQYPKYGLYHADELCVGQFYLNMYDKYKEDKMLKSTKERLDYILNNPPDTNMSIKSKQSWTWSDALFMAPAVYLQMGNATGDNRYIDFMDKEFKRTTDHLYSKDEKLYYRDDSYFGKKEANGKDVFWGRGNGWVAAGIANILKLMPKNSPQRPYYEDLFKELMSRLVELQDKNGSWHASLLDPESYPSPEASATALITYALAYGINNHLLDEKEFLPATLKGWDWLVSAVGPDGKLGWVQPIGADPKKVNENMTAVYGVGAFLMAGSEIHNLKK